MSGGQLVQLQSGVWVPVLGGGISTPNNRQDLIPGTYIADASNTGLLPGYTWDAAGIYYQGVLIPGSVINGDVTPSGTDTLTENKVVNGRFIPTGVRNTIRNCVIRGSAAGPPNGKGNGQGLVTCSGTTVSDARIEDCVICPQKPHYNWTGIYAHHYTAKRCNIFRTVDGANMFLANQPCQAALLGCYIHSLTLFTPDPNHFDPATGLGDNRTHNDIIQCQGGVGGQQIVGNTLVGWLENWPVGEGFVASTSDVTTNPPNVWAPPHVYSASGNCVSTSVIQVTVNVGTPKIANGLEIRKNLIIGGAVGINFSDTGAAVGSQGSAGIIADNLFDHWQGLGGGATSVTGHTIDIGTVWTVEGVSGNVYQNTLGPVQVRSGLRGN